SVRGFLRVFDAEQFLHAHSSPEEEEAEEKKRGESQSQRGYPESVISWCETMDAGTGNYDQAITENIIDTFDFDVDDWKCIDGGSSQLTSGMLAYLGDAFRPQTKKVVTSISPNDSKDKLNLTVKGEE